MLQKLFFSFLVSVFWGSMAFAGYFQFTEPQFEERILVEEVENGAAILVNINTVAVDNQGNLYFLKSDLQRILAEGGTYTYEEMGEIEYSATIGAINLLGEETVFAEARFPLKTSLAGIYYDGGSRRLLVFLETLTLDDECPFLSAALSLEAAAGSALLKKSRSSASEQEPRAWDWSGLENCFFEKLSILEITGFRSITPF